MDAQPWGGKRKGADGGVDGIRWMRTGPNPGDIAPCVVSVEGGDNVTVSMIRDLRTAMENANARAVLFLTLAEPTKPMRAEAAKARLFASPFAQKPYPRVQIWTIRELLAGLRPDLPPLGKDEGFRRAPNETPQDRQPNLGM